MQVFADTRPSLVLIVQLVSHQVNDRARYSLSTRSSAAQGSVDVLPNRPSGIDNPSAPAQAINVIAPAPGETR
jgi:hypothetical protein